jgi:hypothetical protein
MRSLHASVRKTQHAFIPIFAAQFLFAAGILLCPAARYNFANAQEMTPGPQASDPQSPAAPSQSPAAPAPQSPVAPSPAPESAPPRYDPAIFQNPVPSTQLAFLNNFAGKPSSVIIKDKQYTKLVDATMPDCPFHMMDNEPIRDTLEFIFSGMPRPVQIRDARYVMVSGRAGMRVPGRGFTWFDMQTGIALGGIFYYPLNGEPSPTLTIFSRQVKEKSLEMSQLPPAFVEDLNQWAVNFGVKRVATRYFITGSNEKILLAHDEDYCQPVDAYATPGEGACEQMNADAADLDMAAAYYLEQTDHIPYATEQSILGSEEVVWIQTRDVACRGDSDPLRCHIRMTREHTRVIVNRPPPPHPPRH